MLTQEEIKELIEELVIAPGPDSRQIGEELMESIKELFERLWAYEQRATTRRHL